MTNINNAAKTTLGSDQIREPAIEAPAFENPGEAMGRLEAALDLKRGAEALASLYEQAFGAGGDGDEAKFAAAAAPLIEELAERAMAAHNPLEEKLLERANAAKDKPAEFRAAALELAAHATVEARDIDPKALVGAVRAELVETLAANRPLIDKPGSQWEALGFGPDRALAYYKYLRQAVSTATEGFDMRYAPTDEARKTMERLETLAQYEIEKVTHPRTVAMLLKELHKKATAITAGIPDTSKTEEAPRRPASDPVAPVAEVERAPEPAPAKKEPSPEIRRFKEAVADAMKTSVDSLQAASFTHDQDCAEILSRGADALTKIEELSVLVDNATAPKSFEEARRARADVAALAESASADATACAELAARHFGADGDGVAEATRQLLSKSSELVAQYDSVLQGQLEAGLASSIGSEISATPAAPTPEAEQQLESANAELSAAGADLSGPAEKLAREMLEAVEQIIGSYEAVMAKMGTLKAASDRDAVSKLMSEVAEDVDAFVKLHGALTERIDGVYGAAEHDAAREALKEAIDTLARDIDAQDDKFYDSAQRRFRAMGRAGKSVPDEAGRDPAEIEALATAARAEASEAVSGLVAPHSERCAVAISAAREIVEDTAKISGYEVSGPGDSLEQTAARHSAASAAANSVAERVRAGIETLESGFGAEEYAEGAAKVRGVLESAGKRAEETAGKIAAELREKLWEEISAPIAKEDLSSVPAPLAEALTAWNRGRISTDPGYIKVEIVRGDDATPTIVITKPNATSQQWIEAHVKGNRLQLGAANVPSVGKAQMSFDLANENEAARYAAAFLSDATPRSDASLKVAGSPIIRRLLADPEARCLTIQNAHVKSESWREVLPALTGATLNAVVLDDIDAKGARVADLKLKNVTVKRFDNLFGEMSVECLGRCDLGDRSNRWGNVLRADLGTNGVLAGNAQHTKLELKGLVMEYAKRAAELRGEIAEAEKAISEIQTKLEIQARGERGMLSHVGEHGGIFSLSGWRNGLKAWRSAKAEKAALGMDDEAKIAAEKRKTELEEQLRAMNAELERSNKEVRTRAGNLVLSLPKSDQNLRPQSAALTASERSSLDAQRGTFADLVEVTKSRANGSSSVTATRDTLKISKAGFTIVIDRFASRAGDETGYATIQILREDGSRMPINIGGEPREMVKLRYATALRTADGILAASPDKLDELVRKLYYARSRDRETRRIRGADEAGE